MVLMPLTALATQNPAHPFPVWLEALKNEARQQGISEPTLEAAFRAIVPNERIIALDRKQPEKRKSFQHYRESVVTKARITKGRALLRQHQALLQEVSARYGVQPEFIVSLWGIETSFGQNTGGTRIIDGLTTLAFEGRRGEFFRRELLLALKILDQHTIAPNDFKGSWAGAMGQPQFMPSSYYHYAVDYDGDGFANIWHSYADIFASIANYLATNGWDASTRWGRKVRLPAAFDTTLAGLDQQQPVTGWAKTGVRNADGTALPASSLPASLILLNDRPEDAYLVYNNYRTLMHWNRSTYFATSVSLLAEAITLPQK